MRLGPWEMALIAMFVVILFGARKIPEIMRGLGSGVREFKDGLREDEKEKDGVEKSADEKKDVKE